MSKESKSSKQSRWLKNLGRSAMYGVGKVFSGRYSESDAFRDDIYSISKDVASTTRDTIKNRRQIFKKLLSGDSQISKDLRSSYSDAKKTLQTGDLFPNKDDGFDDNFDDDFDDDYGFSDDDYSESDDGEYDTSTDGGNESVTKIVVDTSATAKSISHLDRTTKSGHMMTAESISKLATNIKLSTVHTTKSIQKSAEVMANIAMAAMVDSRHAMEANVERLEAIYGKVDSINTFNTEIMNKFVQGSLVYYDESLSVMKRMLEIQESTMPKQTQDTTTFYSKNSDIFSGGGINAEALMKAVKSNFDNSMVGMVLGQLTMGTSMGDSILKNPIGKLFELGVEKLIPKAIDSSLKSLDSTLANVGPAIFKRLTKELEKSDILNVFGLADLFKFSGNKAEMNTGKYTGQQFDDITHRTINQVIPTYLSKILSALTNTQDEHYFDYDTGKWTSREIAESRRARDIDYLKDNETSSLSDRVEDIIGTIDLDSTIKDSIISEIGTLRKEIVEGTITWAGKDIDELLKNSSISDTISDATKNVLNAAAQTMSTAEHLKMYNAKERYDDSVGRYNNDKTGRRFNLDYIINDGWGADSIAARDRELKERQLAEEEKKRKLEEAKRKMQNGIFDNGSVNAFLFGDDGSNQLDILSGDKILDSNAVLEMAKNNRKNPKDTKSDFTGRLTRYLNNPINVLSDTINKMDSTIYNIIFGDSPDGDGSIITKITDKIKETFETVKKFITEKVLKPIGEFFKKDSVKTFFDNVKTKFTQGFTETMFGKKGKNGAYDGGFFSYFRNSLTDIGGYFKQVFTGRSFTTTDGKTVVAKFEGVGDSLRKSFNDGLGYLKAYLFGGDEEANKKAKETSLVTNIANSLSKGYQIFSNTFFGTDMSEKRAGQGFNAFFKRKLPRMAGKGTAIGIGLGALSLTGGMGVLGSLFLPGGPIGAIIAGTGIAFLSESERFKRTMFGEKDADGKRTGGIVSKKVINFWNKNKVAILGGGAFGLLKSAILGFAGVSLGPIGVLPAMATSVLGPVLMGSATGLAVKSKAFQDIIFGKEGTSRGKLSASVGKYIKKAIPTASFGALAGGGLGLFGGSFGILGSFINPVGGALLGGALGLAMASEKFKTSLFGKFDEKTGTYKSGFIDKMKNALNLAVIEPIKIKFAKSALAIEKWFVKSIANPLRDSLFPLKLMAKDIAAVIKDKVTFALKKSVEMITKPFDPITKAITALLKGTFNVLKKTTNTMLNKITWALGKMIASPFALLKFATGFATGYYDRKIYKQNMSGAVDRFKNAKGVKNKLGALWNLTKTSVTGTVDPNNLSGTAKAWYEYKQQMKERNAKQDAKFSRRAKAISKIEERHKARLEEAKASGFDLEDVRVKKELELQKRYEEKRQKLIDGESQDQLTAINQQELEVQEENLGEQKKHTNILEDIRDLFSSVKKQVVDGISDLSAADITVAGSTDLSVPGVGTVVSDGSFVSTSDNRHSDDDPSNHLGGATSADINAQRNGANAVVGVGMGIDDDGSFVNTTDNRHSDDDPNRKLGGLTAADIIAQRKVEDQREEDLALKEKEIDVANKSLEEQKKTSGFLDNIWTGMKMAGMVLEGILAAISALSLGKGFMDRFTNPNRSANPFNEKNNGTSYQRVAGDSLRKYILRPLAKNKKVDEYLMKKGKGLVEGAKDFKNVIQYRRLADAEYGGVTAVEKKALANNAGGRAANYIYDIPEKMRAGYGRAKDYAKDLATRSVDYTKGLYGKAVQKITSSDLYKNITINRDLMKNNSAVRDIKFNPFASGDSLKGANKLTAEELKASKTWVGWMTRNTMRIQSGLVSVGKGLISLPEKIASGIAGTYDKISTKVATKLEPITNAIGRATEAIKKPILSIAEKTKNKAIDYAEKISGKSKTLYNAGKTKASEYALKAEALRDKIAKKGGDIASKVKNKATDYADKANALKDKIAKKGSDVAEKFANKSSEIGAKAAEKAKDLAKAASEPIKKASQTVVQDFKAIVSGGKEGASQFVTELKPAMEALGNFKNKVFQEIATSPTGQIINYATNRAGEVVDDISEYGAKKINKAAELTESVSKKVVSFGEDAVDLAKNSTIASKSKEMLAKVSEAKESGMYKTFMEYTEKGLNSIASSSSIKKALGSGVGEFIGKIAGTLKKVTIGAFKKILPKFTAAVSKTVAGTASAGVLTALFAGYDAYTGARDAAAMFGVAEKDVTAGMRTTASLMQVVMGMPYIIFIDLAFEAVSLLTGGAVDFKKDCVTWLYSCMPGVEKEDMERLGKAQAADDAERQAYEDKLNEGITDEKQKRHVSKDEWTEHKNEEHAKEVEAQGGSFLHAAKQTDIGKWLFGENDENGEYKNGVFADMGKAWDTGMVAIFGEADQEGYEGQKSLISKAVGDIGVWFTGGTYSDGTEEKSLKDRVIDNLIEGASWLFGEVDKEGNVVRESAISKAGKYMDELGQRLTNGFIDFGAWVVGGEDSRGQHQTSILVKGINGYIGTLTGFDILDQSTGNITDTKINIQPHSGLSIPQLADEYIITPFTDFVQNLKDGFNVLADGAKQFYTESANTIQTEGVVKGTWSILQTMFMKLMNLDFGWGSIQSIIDGAKNTLSGYLNDFSKFFTNMSNWWKQLSFKKVSHDILKSIFGEKVANVIVPGEGSGYENMSFLERTGKAISDSWSELKNDADAKDPRLGNIARSIGSGNPFSFSGSGDGGKTYKIKMSETNIVPNTKIQELGRKSDKSDPTTSENFVNYRQDDGDWSNLSVLGDSPSYGSMKDFGCGPTVLASAMANVTGNTDIDPKITASLVSSPDVGLGDKKGINPAYFSKAAESLGGSVYDLDISNEGAILDSITKGGTLILGGTNRNAAGTPFTKSGHYVMANGGYVQNGKPMLNIYDPLGKHTKGYAVSDILRGMRDPSNPGFASVITRKGVDASAYVKGAKYIDPDTVKRIQEATIFRGRGPDITGDDILEAGKKYIGMGYGLGADGNGNKLDCGLFTLKAFADVGLDLTNRCADEQARFFDSKGALIDVKDAKPGDLVFFQRTYQVSAWNDITHVGIYAGENKMLHCGSSKGVCFQTLGQSNFGFPTYVAGSIEKAFGVPNGKGLGPGGITESGGGSASKGKGKGSAPQKPQNPLERFLSYYSEAAKNASTAMLTGQVYKGTPLNPPASKSSGGRGSSYDGAGLGGSGGQSDLPPDVIGDPDKFVEYMGPIAQDVYKNTESGALPSVTVAQAALESGWGKYGIGNNIFGIKADSGWKGEKILKNTREEDQSGNSYYVDAYFRDYPTIRDGVLDHDRFLVPYGIKGITDPFAQIQQIQSDPNARYATANDYVEKISSTIRANDLTRFDGAGLGFTGGGDSDSGPQTKLPSGSYAKSVSSSLSMFGGGADVATAMIADAVAQKKFEYKPTTVYSDDDIAPDYDEFGNIIAKDMPVNNKVTSEDSIDVIEGKQEWQRQWWAGKSREEKEAIRKANQAIQDAKKENSEANKDATASAEEAKKAAETTAKTAADAAKSSTATEQKVKEVYDNVKKELENKINGTNNKIEGVTKAADKAIATMNADTASIVSAIKSLDIRSEVLTMIKYLQVIAEKSGATAVAATKTASAATETAKAVAKSNDAADAKKADSAPKTSGASVAANATASSRNMNSQKAYDTLHALNLKIAKGGEFKRG